MTPRRLAVCIVVALMLLSDNVLADAPLPNGHVTLKTGEGQLVAPNGTTYTLPVGSHILDGTTWEKLDVEVRRLQDKETRLDAENKSLKDSLQATPKMGWTAAFLLVGFMTVTGGVAYMISTH
jgi:hypothetical protein